MSRVSPKQCCASKSFAKMMLMPIRGCSFSASLMSAVPISHIKGNWRTPVSEGTHLCADSVLNSLHPITSTHHPIYSRIP